MNLGQMMTLSHCKSWVTLQQLSLEFPSRDLEEYALGQEIWHPFLLGEAITPHEGGETEDGANDLMQIPLRYWI